jgi:WbqC-like protein family
MSRVLLPSCPFPPITWCAYASEGEVELNLCEHYVKQTWRNRYAIASSHGREILTIPVTGQKGRKVAASDITIFGSEWRRQHMQAIRSAYGKSAFYIYLEEDLVKLIVEGRQHFLVDFNDESLRLCERFTSIRDFQRSVSHVEMNNKLWEPAYEWPLLPEYTQVFSDRMPFIQGLSVLDLIMNTGKRSLDYILLLKNGGLLPSMNPDT